MAAAMRMVMSMHPRRAGLRLHSRLAASGCARGRARTKIRGVLVLSRADVESLLDPRRADRRARHRDGGPERGPRLDAEPRRGDGSRARRAARRDAGLRAVARRADRQARDALPAQRGRAAADAPGADRRVRPRDGRARRADRRDGDHGVAHRRRLGAVGAAAGARGRPRARDRRHGRAGPGPRTGRAARARLRRAARRGTQPGEGRAARRGAARQPACRRAPRPPTRTRSAAPTSSARRRMRRSPSCGASGWRRAPT